MASISCSTKNALKLKYIQGRISTNSSRGGGGSGQEFFEGGSRSSKRQVGGNFHTDKQKINLQGGGDPPLLFQ